MNSQLSGLAKRGYLPLESYPGRGISDEAYRDKEETLPIESSVFPFLHPTAALKTRRNGNGRIKQAVTTMADSMAFYKSERGVGITAISSQTSGIIDIDNV